MFNEKQLLMTTLRGYQAWIKDGSKPYALRSGLPPEQTQWLYDPYYYYMSQEGDSNRFRFNIQISDHPDGDTWWEGSFELINDIDVKILEQSLVNN